MLGESGESCKERAGERKGENKKKEMNNKMGNKMRVDCWTAMEKIVTSASKLIGRGATPGFCSQNIEVRRNIISKQVFNFLQWKYFLFLP